MRNLATLPVLPLFLLAGLVAGLAIAVTVYYVVVRECVLALLRLVRRAP
jgi:hypothetical protein